VLGRRLPRRPLSPDVLDLVIDVVTDLCNDITMDEQWALGDAGPLSHAGHESHLLRDVIQTHQVLMAAFARAVGTSAARVPLLRLLAVAGDEGVGTAALARSLGVDASGVTRALAVLVADGLAERRPHSTDGRRALFVLTPEGQQWFEEFHERMHRFEAMVCAGALPDDLRTTAEVLAAVREAVLGMEKS
jgi:DNA-binding MarR family transcriptional regulator